MDIMLDNETIKENVNPSQFAAPFRMEVLSNYFLYGTSLEQNLDIIFNFDV